MNSFSWPVAILRFLAVDNYKAVLFEVTLPCSPHTDADPSISSLLGYASFTARKRGAAPGDWIDLSSVGAPPSSGEWV